MKRSQGIFEAGDIVEFTERNGNTKTGYITKNQQIRCPYPEYETHPIPENTTIIKKDGWK